MCTVSVPRSTPFRFISLQRVIAKSRVSIRKIIQKKTSHFGRTGKAEAEQNLLALLGCSCCHCCLLLLRVEKPTIFIAFTWRCTRILSESSMFLLALNDSKLTLRTYHLLSFFKSQSMRTPNLFYKQSMKEAFPSILQHKRLWCTVTVVRIRGAVKSSEWGRCTHHGTAKERVSHEFLCEFAHKNSWLTPWLLQTHDWVPKTMESIDPRPWTPSLSNDLALSLSLSRSDQLNLTVQ